jgi:hypothetical protein
MRPATTLLAILPLVALSSALRATAQDKPVGLPDGGAVDTNKVLAARYGQPATGAAPATPVAAAATRTITGGITGVFVDNQAAGEQASVPVTFGQVFAPGDVGPADRLEGRLEDGTRVPVQVDAKARHPDGSLRHAVVTAIVPVLAPRQSLMLALVKAQGKPAPGKPAAPAELLKEGFQANVSVRLDGREWQASAARLLAGKNVQAWLAGPLATEWLVDAPLTDERGVAHPHLHARFAIRWYPQAHKARVDVTVENDWAYEPGPRNFTYDARIAVGGKDVYAKPGLTHLHHARWRKVFWWGDAPAVHLRQDTPYLIATRALPNYDRRVVVADAALAGLATRWTGPSTEPMGIGLATAYMPTTGGRSDIGLLPDWAAMYLLSMDPRAATATLGTADLAGSWSIHFRDRRTGDPISIVDHPYMTIAGRPSDTIDPATGKSAAFPPCAGDKACDTPYSADLSHQPNFAYLPYLLTGDHYYLEELLFWASFDALWSNPGYRERTKGLVKDDQVRGQAWTLRTLGEAAYIAPDDHRLKRHLTAIVQNNLDWYNKTYTDNPKANRLHVIVNGYAMSYNDGRALALWQDDFFTAAIGHLADLGFADARRLLGWKAPFSVARMTDPGTCWIDGAAYNLTVRKRRDGPELSSYAEAYAASHDAAYLALPCAGGEMATALKLRVGEMTGFSNATIGFPSNMQPALAYAADVTGAAGRRAWKQFMARTVIPDYGRGPQFAIVPRSVGDDGESTAKE